MKTFIMTGKYTPEAVRQISGERTTKAGEIVQQCGGKLVAAFATLGDSDLLAIMEFSSVAEAMKASVALNKALAVSFSTMPAIRIEEFDVLIGGKG